MKKVNITEKLSFEEKPIIVIKNEEFEIDDSAVTVLKLMGIFEDGSPSASDLSNAANLIFGEEGVSRLHALKLNFDDFTTVTMEAVDLILGESEGE